MSVVVEVRVPASTSNLGAGFDCVGVAIDRWLSLTAQIEPVAVEPVRLERSGTLEPLSVALEHDRIVAAFRAACRAKHRTVPHGVWLRASSSIPVARGLGSSAAATVAGAAAAVALLRMSVDDQELVELCVALEGHPDNVVPAIHGGAVLAIPAPLGSVASGTDGSLMIAPIEMHESLALVLAVPDFQVETAYMRAALPGAVPHAVAARAAALGAALVSGLTSGHPGVLARALDDVLHVPYRREYVTGYEAVVAAAKGAGAYGTTLSGSGSSLCAVAPKEVAPRVAAAMCDAWKTMEVEAEGFVCDTAAGGYSVLVRRDERPDAEAPITAKTKNQRERGVS